MQGLVRMTVWAVARRAASKTVSAPRFRPSSPAGIHLPLRAHPGGRRAEHQLPHLRSRPGGAALLLPVEQQSRRRAGEAGLGVEAARSAVLEAQVRRDAGRSAGRGTVDQLRVLLAAPAEPEGHESEQLPVPELRHEPDEVDDRETQLFFDSIVREDRPITKLLTADYTYVDDRLARHYGLPNVLGSRFRRVPVTDENRRGLLGHASVLALTSHANRTSPVLRGKWVMDVPARHAAGQAAGQHPAAAGEHRRRQTPAGAGAPRGAPQEPGVRRLPPRDGPDRLRRSKTTMWSVCGARRTAACRSMPRALLGDGTPVNGPAACATRCCAGRVLFERKFTEDLLMYGMGRVDPAPRHAGRAGDSARARRHPACDSRPSCSAS